MAHRKQLGATRHANAMGIAVLLADTISHGIRERAIAGKL